MSSSSFKIQETEEHKCEICEEEFSTKQKLKRHFSEIHDQNRKVYNCNICTKSFPIKKNRTVVGRTRVFPHVV